MDKKNAVLRAYEKIKSDIVAFAIIPGERINEVELAAALEMSRAPVREALNRLVAGGFVSFDSGRGFFCRRFSASEIADLFEVRRDLETAAIRRACAVAGDSDIAALAAACEDTLQQQAALAAADLVLRDEAFHLGVAALAGNAERLVILRNINERIRFVRQISIESPERRQSLVDEHRRLIDAIARHDEAEAAALIAYHLDLNSRDLKANIQEGLTRIYAKEIV